MGSTRSDIYSKDIVTLASMAKVFSHPARVAILQYISKQPSCICNDIVDEIGLSQPTISQHLKIINEAGLLKGNFKGTRICYCLDTDRFEHFRKALNGFFEVTQTNCC